MYNARNSKLLKTIDKGHCGKMYILENIRDKAEWICSWGCYYDKDGLLVGMLMWM